MKKKNFRRGIVFFLIFVIIVIFGYIQAIGYIIPGFKEIFSLNYKTTTVQQIGLMWVPFVSYIILATAICFFVGIFKKLKPFSKEEFLTTTTPNGLVVGYIQGIITSFCMGLFIGFITGLIWGLAIGFIGGFVFMFSIEIIAGSIVNIIREFDKK
jgi:hypothetical protein